MAVEAAKVEPQNVRAEPSEPKKFALQIIAVVHYFALHRLNRFSFVHDKSTTMGTLNKYILIT